MNKRLNQLATLTVLISIGYAMWMIANDATPTRAADTANPVVKKAETDPNQAPATTNEARDRARLLHQTIHGLLQAVHQHYYREGEKLPLPSATFEEVFEELADDWKVELHWMAVNGKAMRINHRPQDDFEKAAVKALAAGEQEFSKSEGNTFRHVGAIRLSSRCLKCHVPNRTSLEDRIAALVIAMPIKMNKKRSK